MAVEITTDYMGSVEVPKSPDLVLAYLRDFEKAIPGNFPGLASFSPISGDTFRWKFKDVEHSGKVFKIEFSTKMSASGNFILIEPTGQGIGELQGAWKVDPSSGGSLIVFQAALKAEVPIPRLLKGIAGPIIQKELVNFFDRYLNNVAKTLKS